MTRQPEGASHPKREGRGAFETEILLDVLLTTGRRPGYIVGVATDITRRRKVEQEAAARSRLQVLGELSGGIAHDFNNILLVINGTTELLLEIDDLREVRRRLADVRASGARAAELAQRLLLFGRRDHQPESSTDLNAPIRDLDAFCRQLLGNNHRLEMLLHTAPLGVPLDRTDIEQVLSNLVINARDAMIDGGDIRVRTTVETIDGREWAILAVEDSGIGMDAATQSRIFEPFFTTKSLGNGTGLGLSTVWGIVSGSGGRIEVDSSLGVGTTMTARWERVELPPPPDSPRAKPAASPVQQPNACRSILVVEDDSSVAEVAKSALIRAGYRVRLAADGREGLKIFSERPDDFDLVFSDLVLPHLNGVEMAQQIRSLRPSVRVGFCTGYRQHPSLSTTPAPEDWQLLQKPFSVHELEDFVAGCMSDAHGTADHRSNLGKPDS